MLKIKDLEIGKYYTIPLVVTSVTARETKTKKPYLTLEFYDGTDKIAANYWDWAGKVIPEKNSILNVNAQLTEYLGTPQLNIKSLTTNKELHISAFTPSGGADIGEVYKEAFSMATDFTDDLLRNLTLLILEQLQGRWVPIKLIFNGLAMAPPAMMSGI